MKVVMLYSLLTVLMSFFIDLLTLSFKSSLDKNLEILALRHQLRLLQRRQTSRLHCTRFEKLVLAVLAFKLKPRLKQTGRLLSRPLGCKRCTCCFSSTWAPAVFISQVVLRIPLLRGWHNRRDRLFGHSPKTQCDPGF